MQSSIRPIPSSWSRPWRRIASACCLILAAGVAFARDPSPIPPAAAPSEAPYEMRKQIEALAGTSVSAVSFYRVYYWTPLDERSLVLWLGREEPYLIQLREACVGYARDRTLRLSEFQRPGRNKLRTRWSMVFTREGRSCALISIQPLDLEGMRRLAPPYSLPEEKDAPADR